jgi:two-component system sensor histidine kinase KdpD
MAGAWAANDRLVVAVSEQPGAAELVRAAKRLADALRAPWTAVYMETPRSGSFTDAENAQLAETMHLAAQLGGQVATVPAENVVEGLKRFTAEARATQLIVGKSTRSRWFELRHGSVVDRLVRETPGIAVHVLPMSKAAPPAATAKGRSGSSWGKPSSYAVSLVLVALVTFFGILIFGHGSITNIALLYLLPVMLAATRYGLRNAVTTALVSSLAYNFFFIPPTHAFTIQDPQNIISILVLLGVAAVSSQLAARVRAQALLAQGSAAQNSALAGFARLLTGISRRDELAQLLCAEIGRLLDTKTVVLMPGDDGLELRSASPPGEELEMLDVAAARWAGDHNRPAGRGSDTLTASEWLFQPISAGGRVLAVFGLARSDARAPIRSDQLPLLLSLLDQAGLALERIALEEEMGQLSQIRERDRLRQSLLSSVSHDLRTPLTTVLGTLRELKADTPEQAEQLAAARAEAERLHRFVGNLLDMVRIEAGSLHGTTEPVDLAEAVASASHDLRAALQAHPVRLDIAPDLPFVLADPQLFHHCLINLIENAAKYGNPGAPITVSARRDPQGLTLTVSDEGPGLPPGEEARLFETFTRLEGSDRKGGTGLGLAIVKGFAEAMGLSVAAANRTDRPGACFAIRFDAAHLKTDWTTQ